MSTSEHSSAAGLLEKLSPRRLVEVVASLLEKMGFEDVRVVDSPGDRGVDIEAVYRGPLGFRERVAVQVKRYRRGFVGHREIQLFAVTIRSEGFNKGIFVSTSGFTRSAYEVAEKHGVTLVDGRTLAELVARYGVKIPVSEALAESEAVPEQPVESISVEKRRAREPVREVATSTPVCLVIDLDKAFLLVKRHITSRYGIDESEISLERAVLEVAPYYVVDWKYYKEGLDELGRRRMRAYRGTYLVSYDGARILDLDRIEESVRREVLRKARMKHGVVRATKVVTAKGIGKREARRRVKLYIQRAYRVSWNDVEILRVRTVLMAQRWLLSLGVGLNTCDAEIAVPSGFMSLAFDRLDRAVLDDLARGASTEATGETVVSCMLSEEKTHTSVYTCETQRFVVRVRVNAYSGRVLEAESRMKPSAAERLALSLSGGGRIVSRAEDEAAYYFAVENEGGLCLVRVDARTGRHEVERGLVGHRAAGELAAMYAEKVLDMARPVLTGVELENMRVWKIGFQSPDGVGWVRVDCKTGEVVGHSVEYSERKAAKLALEEYPGREIAQKAYDSRRKLYLFKLVDEKLVYEVQVHASTGEVTLAGKYLKPEIAKKRALEQLRATLGESEARVIAAELKDQAWIVTADTPTWRYWLRLSPETGHLLAYSRLLTPQGAAAAAYNYAANTLGLTLENVDHLVYVQQGGRYLVNIRAESEDKLVYLSIDAATGQVVEYDTVSREGILSAPKRKLLNRKYKIKE